MVDLSAIASALAALKGIKDLAETMMGLRDAESFQQKRLEMQALIIDAQNGVFAANEERAALIERVRALEAKIADLEAWEAEKQKYKLAQLRPGLFAYALKEEATNGEPSHSICQNCYEQGQKSILQIETRFPGRREFYVCNNCGSELTTVREAAHPRPKVITRRPRDH